jgi:transposase-like protein
LPAFASLPHVIVLAVRWCLRFRLSYRDVEALLTERSIEVDHVTVYRWVPRFSRCWPRLPDRAGTPSATAGRSTRPREGRRPVALRRPGDRPDWPGQQCVRLLARDANAAPRFFQQAIGATKVAPAEVITDKAPVYPGVLEELLPAAWHRSEQYENNRVEAAHGRLKARLRPMRGLKQDRSAEVLIAGHALVQDVRRGHYELAVGFSTAPSRHGTSVVTAGTLWP